MRPRLAMRLLPLAWLLAVAALASADQAGGASGTPDGEAREVPGESPTAPMEQAGEGPVSGSGEVDASGAEASGEGQADASGAEASGEGQAGEEEETTLKPIALQDSILSNANVNLPQDI